MRSGVLIASSAFVLISAGCGEPSAIGASQESSESIGSGSISIEYTIDVDEADPLCRTASIGSVGPWFSCSADLASVAALGSDAVGDRVLEIYILPLAAQNPRLEPSHPSRLVDNYLVIERSLDEPRAVLQYGIQGVTVECELNGVFSECQQITR